MAKPGHIYHWKHGWIPITPRAAMVKAKGRRSTADKYMHHYHIEDHRQEGRERRQGGSLEGGNGHRKGTDDRGTFTYKPGTRTRDYPDRGPAPHLGAKPPAAERPPVPVRPSKDFRPGHDIPRKDEPFVYPPNPLGSREADINGALPHGHTVTSLGTWDRHLVNGTPVGRVEETHGGFRAYLTDQKPGSFNVKRTYVGDRHETRTGAHQALAAAHIKREQDKLAKAKRAQTKAAGIQGVAGPNGTTWEAHTLPDDGTVAGRAANAKVKAAFRAGNHEVVIESSMTEAETRRFLANVSSAVDRSAPNLRGTGVKFYVPTGDTKFRSHNGKVTGAYVRIGGTTVHVNPKVANGVHGPAFEAGGHSGHFMPAGKSEPLEYTLVHELGHVADNVHHHSDKPDTLTPSGFSIPMGNNEGVAALHRQHAYASGSKYSRENAHEGYAEAFAQYHIGGAGSHPMSDAYAAHFGWNAPGGIPRAEVKPPTSDLLPTPKVTNVHEAPGWSNAAQRNIDVPNGGYDPDVAAAKSRADAIFREANQFAMRPERRQTIKAEIDELDAKLAAAGLPAHSRDRSRLRQARQLTDSRVSSSDTPAKAPTVNDGGAAEMERKNAEALGMTVEQFRERMSRSREKDRLARNGGYAGSLYGTQSSRARRQQPSSSPFDAGHSAGLAKADAARTKPLSSTVKGVREALATLPADVQMRLTKGKSIESMTTEELSAIRRAVIDIAKRKKG